MKKLSLFVAVLLAMLLMTATSMAQPKMIALPAGIQNLAVPANLSVDDPVLPLKPYQGAPVRDVVAEQVIGATRYDMQTNASCQNRFYLYPDGTMGGIWTYGMGDPGYTDRGTGYNYSNGTSWGPAPLSRIESLRTGWPSYAPWNTGGEIVVSHHFATFPALMLTRPVKGAGAWAEVEIAPPAGAMGIDWPRMITSGPDHMTIHMIALTTPSASGGAVYEGLDGAIVYYRSLDGGASWDIEGMILPQMTSTDYLGFSADDYAWMKPHGDTIAFVLGGHWTDTFIMVSYDNGTNWEKIPILNNGNIMVPSGEVTDIFACCDGSVALEMDNDGVFHVVFGRMRAKGESDGRKYYPGTDGLIYWNSTMPMLNDSLDPDTLEAHGQLLGYVVENTAGDTIIGFPFYGVSMSSFPQITIDDNGRIFVIWSGLTVGNPSPEEWNYRHIWSRASLNHGQTWSEMTDLNSSIIYMNREFVYPSMAKNTTPNEIHFIYQSADTPGSSVSDATVPIHDNTIEYRSEPKETVIGVENRTVLTNEVVSQNFPNPFHSQTMVDVMVAQSSTLLFIVRDLLGHQVYSADRGIVTPGTYRFLIDGSGWAPGIYFYTVVVNGEKITKKMIAK